MVNGICGAAGSAEVEGVGAGVEIVVGSGGVFTGGGGASPRQVVVIALSGCAQLITPSIVNGMSFANEKVVLLETKVIENTRARRPVSFFILFILFCFTCRSFLSDFFLRSFLHSVLG